MKWLKIIALITLLGSTGYAQQDPLFSQYMLNGLVLNPAYAGAREQGVIRMLGRQQWVGLAGAPSTFSLAFHTPSRNLRHGYGLSLIHDRFSPTTRTHFALSYAFRIPVGSHSVSFGLQGGLDNLVQDFSNIYTPDNGDPSFTGEVVNMLRPVAGTGIFILHENYYLGASVPNIINYPRRSASLNPDGEARHFTHYLFTGGMILPLGKSVKFKPSTLLRVVSGAPVSLDLNASFLFLDKIWLGSSWRIRDSWVFLLEYRLSRQLRFGYSYDLPNSALSTFQSGSHELMIGIDFGVVKDRMLTPRYF